MSDCPHRAARRRSAGALRVAGMLLAASLLAAAGPARAQGSPIVRTGPAEPGSPAAVKQAKDHFERALEAYRKGDYRAAIRELDAALELDPRGKDLVYNLALVYEKLGELDRAIEYLERYEKMEVNQEERDRARGAIERLRGAREELEEPQESGAAPSAQPRTAGGSVRPSASGAPAEPDAGAEPQRGRFDGWVAGAGVVAITGIAIGTIFGLRALLKHPGSEPTTNSDTSVRQLRDDANDAHDSAVIADVAFAIGFVAAGAGVGLYYLRPAEPEADSGAERGGSAFGVSVGGHF